MGQKTRFSSCSISGVQKKKRTCQLETMVCAICALRSLVRCNSTPAVVLPLRPFKLNGPFSQKTRSPCDRLNGTVWKVFFDVYCTCNWSLPVDTATYYRIAGNFRGIKLSRKCENRRFRGENFRGSTVGWDACAHVHLRPSKFAEKTFTNGSKPAKFAKVLSLESFPLYGICLGEPPYCALFSWVV